jgi:hypothetical protein
MQLSVEHVGFATPLGGWSKESSDLDSFRTQSLLALQSAGRTIDHTEVELNPRFAHTMELLRSPKGSSGRFSSEVAGPLLHLYAEMYGNNIALLNSILEIHPAAARHKVHAIDFLSILIIFDDYAIRFRCGELSTGWNGLVASPPISNEAWVCGRLHQTFDRILSRSNSSTHCRWLAPSALALPIPWGSEFINRLVARTVAGISE